MSNNSFCRHLSNGFRIFIQNGNITWLPCCYWDGPAKPFVNLVEQRDQLNLSTPWAHSECGKCRQEESYKKEKGYRLVGNRIIPETLPSTKVGWLDIQADITCNGGCLMCGPWSSSYWQSELSKYKEFTLMPNTENLKQSIDKIFSDIDVSELAQLQFLGGEPFLSTADIHAFEHITNPEICQLKYTTNGSIFPKDNRIQRWSKFKSVMINFSIDGIGDRFEYLRYPLKWSTVQKNVLRFINEGPDNLTFHINHSVTPLNILYHQEFVDWVDTTFPKERFKGIHVHPAYGTMSVANSSNKLRELVLEKYGKDHTLIKMLNGLTDNQHFLNYINTWDSRRGTNWRTVFPEIADCFSTS